MATKTIYTSYTGSTALASIEIDYTYTQNITNNTSTVTASAYAKRLHSGAYGYRNQPVNFALTIDGSVKNHAWTFNMGNVSVGSRIFITSHSKTINHNSDGKHPGVTIKAYSVTETTTFGTINGSFSMGLATIPRYAKITSFTVSDVRIDRATINYSTDRTVTDARYAIWNTNGTVFRAWTSASNGLAITGLAPNTSYDIGIRVTNPSSGLLTYSAKKRITTVRLSTGTIVNRDVHAGNPIILNISRANSNITHNVTMQFWADNQTYVNLKTVNGVGTSVDLTLSSAERDTLYQNRRGSKTTDYRVLIRSIWSGEKGSVYSNTARLTMTDNEVVPTLSGVTYKDTNTVVQNIISNDQKILRNISTVRFNAGTASPKKWSSIKSYTVTFNGNTFTKNSSATTGVYIDTGKVNATKATTATLAVTDSRGFTTSRSITVDVLDYVAPQFIDNKAVRTNNYEEPSYLVTQNRRSIVKINNIDQNLFNLRYRFKNTNSEAYGAWITVTTTNTNTQGLYQNVTTNEFIDDLPNDQSYNVQVQIKDRFTDWQTEDVVLTKGLPLMSFTEDITTISSNLRVMPLRERAGFQAVGKTHIYMELHPYGLEGGRKAYIGFPAINNNSLTISNEESSDINLITRTGYETKVNGQTVIIENGTNQNGNYIKFGDGTMICTYRFSFTSEVTTAWGSLFYSSFQTWIFPKRFVGDAPMTSLTPANSDAWSVSSSVSVSNTSFYLTRPVALTSREWEISCIAIGRWK